jgi:hypothetical protein
MMPKRLIDDSLLTSPSLAKCSPRAQDAFPRFILLADDFGCFEAFPRVLRAKGWPYREDVSEGDVWTFLEEYVAAGMACVWTEGERRWGYLTGWHGPHGQKKRVEYDPTSVTGSKGSKRRTPPPPADLVAAVVAGTVRAIDGKPPGTDRETPDEIPSLSVPAREVAVSRQVPGEIPAASRSIPAPVVPVPDAVAAAQQIPPSASAKPRARLISGLGAADPEPEITAVLAGLWERGVDAAPPSSRSAERVRAAILAAGIPLAIERLAAVYANPEAKKPLTYHVEAIRGEAKPQPTRGDLGSELRPWPLRLTEAEREQARAEFTAIHPDLADAPLQATGDPSLHDVEAIRAFHQKWRAVAEARP